MPKSKTLFVCDACGAQSLKWQGQCVDCGTWNSLQESAISLTANRGTPKSGGSSVKLMQDLEPDADQRVSTGIAELDRVLGGGLVLGSVILLGGDPGIGKSTLMLQAAVRLSDAMPVLYVTGEESLRQVSMRLSRLGLSTGTVSALAETSVEQILGEVQAHGPRVLVIDSIQTMFSETLQSAPGAVAQLRESTAQLVRFAKSSGTAVFLVGHVTKEGVIAGPRVLEHMVDTVLYFESDAGSRFRIVRAVKNRFGAANEIGVFAMTESGLKEVKNPSSIFLSQHPEAVPGSVVMVAREGSRPILVEVQALVEESHGSHPRRLTVGLEQNRLSLLLAVLHRHGGVPMYDQNVFVNVVGGMRVSETAADLPALLSAVSSFRDHRIARDTVVFGEVGLAGEIRPVPYGEERLVEAGKHGFRRAVVPLANAPKKPVEGLEIVGVRRLPEAIDHLF